MRTLMTWSFHLPPPAGTSPEAGGTRAPVATARTLLGPPSGLDLDATAEAIRRATAAWLAATEPPGDAPEVAPRHHQWSDRGRSVEHWRRARTDHPGFTEPATVWLGRDAQGLWLHATAECTAPPGHPEPIEGCDVPALVRAWLATSTDWRRRGRLVARSPVHIEGASAAQRIVSHLADVERSCPVVVLSTPPGQGAEAVQARGAALAEAFMGNATVVVVDTEAGRALKRQLGRLACYDGAVRVYLSPFSAQDPPARHPYLLRASVWQGEAAADTARLCGWLRPLLAAHARATLAEPALFDAVVQAARVATGPAEAEWMKIAEERDAVVNEQRARLQLLEGQLDQQAFEFELLREERDRLAADLRVAHENMRALLDPYRSEATPPPASLASEPDDWDESLAALDADHPVEVMRAAGERHRASLRFIDDWEKEAGRLHPEAVTPAKLAAHLDLLAELSALRKKGGSLGTVDREWLSLKGAPTTGESATDRTNGVSRQARTWKVDGKPELFELHIKPKEGTKPNRCARIYFRWCAEREQVLVWLGPHPDP